MSRLLLLFLPLVLACSSKPRDPEAEVRAAVGALEKAIEDADIGRVKELIGDDYKDNKRYDKPKVVSTLQFIFIRRKSVHILTNIREVVVAEDGRTAQVDMVAAATAMPVANASVLARLGSGDVFDMQFEMARDGADWRVTSSKWKRASGDLSRMFERALE